MLSQCHVLGLLMAMQRRIMKLCSPSFHFIFNQLQVTGPVNRQKALLMFINLVRWVRTVHEQRLLPVHRHALFKVMPRRSPYSGECNSSCNVHLMLLLSILHVINR